MFFAGLLESMKRVPDNDIEDSRLFGSGSPLRREALISMLLRFRGCNGGGGELFRGKDDDPT